jgi:hypothetical protein
MGIYRDSVGNVYSEIQDGSKGRPHKAKPRHNKPLPKRTRDRLGYKKAREAKYARYRRNKGKPNGPGMPGNKSGKNKITKR